MEIKKLKEILETDIVFLIDENFNDEFLNDMLLVEVEESVKLFKEGQHSIVREPITKVKDINYDSAIFIRYCNYTKKTLLESLIGANENSLIFIRVNKRLNWSLFGSDEVINLIGQFIHNPRYKFFKHETYREYINLKEVVSNSYEDLNGESKKRRL